MKAVSCILVVIVCLSNIFKMHMRMMCFNFFHAAKILLTLSIFMNSWWNKFSKFWIILLKLFWALFSLFAFVSHVVFMLSNVFFLFWSSLLILSIFAVTIARLLNFNLSWIQSEFYFDVLINWFLKNNNSFNDLVNTEYYINYLKIQILKFIII